MVEPSFEIARGEDCLPHERSRYVRLIFRSYKLRIQSHNRQHIRSMIECIIARPSFYFHRICIQLILYLLHLSLLYISGVGSKVRQRQAAVVNFRGCEVITDQRYPRAPSSFTGQRYYLYLNYSSKLFVDLNMYCSSQEDLPYILLSSCALVENILGGAPRCWCLFS